MKNFFNKFVPAKITAARDSKTEQLKRRVASLYGLYSGLVGTEKVVLRAGKLDALDLLRSDSLPERVLALQKLVFEDPTVSKVPSLDEIPAILEEIEDELADIMARRAVEDKLEKKIAERMEERHREYVHEIKMQVLKERKKTSRPRRR
jgi:ATP-dependent Lon protease